MISLPAEFQKSRVLVAGLDRFGVLAALYMRRLGAQVTGVDLAAAPPGLEPLRECGVRLELGAERPELVWDCDLLVISPAIRTKMQAAPIFLEAFKKGVPVIGELELSHRLLGSGARFPVLAVTGTRGKTVTATLCTHLLRRAGKRVFQGGDANRPLAELVLSGEEVDWAVIEVGSSQLEQLADPKAFVPQIGVWLNLFSDHVERHVTMRNCGRVKRRLFEGMTQKQTGVFWLDDSAVNQHHEGLGCAISGATRNPARVPVVGALLVRRKITPNGWDHPFVLSNDGLADSLNAENATCAVCAAMAAGLDERTIQEGLDTFGVQPPVRPAPPPAKATPPPLPPPLPRRS